MELDLSALENAVERLAEGEDIFRRRAAETIIRDGLIQRFEFTCELAHKTLRRYLKMTAADPGGVEEYSFQELIRTGYQQGLLLHSWDRWKEYRQARTDTRHAYSEAKAARVVAWVPPFLEEARHLLQQLRQRIGAA